MKKSTEQSVLSKRGIFGKNICGWIGVITIDASDFTGLQKKNKTYAGANGSKISVIYEGQQYMLKFPPVTTKNKEMSYSNSCFSEYLGCQIFESIGIPVQKTIMEPIQQREKTENCCGLRRFYLSGKINSDFASLEKSIIDSMRT